MSMHSGLGQLSRYIGEAERFAKEQTELHREIGQVYIALYAREHGVEIEIRRDIYRLPEYQKEKHKIISWETIAYAMINPIVISIKELIDEIAGRKPAR